MPKLTPFYNYAKNKVKDKNFKWNSKVEEKALTWFIYLDWLEGARFNIDSVQNCIESLILSIDDAIKDIQFIKPQIFVQVNKLNQLNHRLLELINDNEKEDYLERFELSKSMFFRLINIYTVLKEEEIDSFVKYHFGATLESIDFMANEIERLTLRHFYSTFKKGQLNQLSVLCIGIGFLRSISSNLFHQLITIDNSTKDGLPTSALIPTYYQIDMMLLDDTFDFLKFDDDTNILIQEVVDLLFTE